MASVYKRESDKARGKAGRWTIVYLDEHGRRKARVGYTDKAESLRLAHKLETEAGQIRAGLIDPADLSRREEESRPIAAHVEDYRLYLVASGDTGKHGGEVKTALSRLFAACGVATIRDLDPLTIHSALAAEPLSARSRNKHRGFVLAFVRWLYDHGRLQSLPRGFARIERSSEDVDRRVVRRALSPPELDRLIRSTHSGPPIVAARGPRCGPHQPVWITGPDRALVYRLAVGTGLRANEIRTLTRECFSLEGLEPTILVRAERAKNGRQAVQPISPALAGDLSAHLTGKAAGDPVFRLPAKTAQMIGRDLATAGIAVQDDQGRIVDFHALRVTYITSLVRSGANPRVVQRLARHSDVKLTLQVYTHVDDRDLHEAVKAIA